MTRAHYILWRRGHHGAADRIGGLPTHLPPAFPRSAATGNALGFLGQFYVHLERLPLSGCLCLQLYQSVEIDEGDDPVVVPVVVPTGAALNENGQGTLHPFVTAHDIDWAPPVEEPDIVPVPPTPDPSSPEMVEFRRMIQSKFGGARNDDEPEPFLGQLREDPGNFNFASWSLGLFRGEGTEVITRLI